jgi:hypothetical protein
MNKYEVFIVATFFVVAIDKVIKLEGGADKKRKI